jgi:hypothetical protein
MFSLLLVTSYLCKLTWEGGQKLPSLPFPVTSSSFLAIQSSSPSPLSAQPTNHPKPSRVFSRTNQHTKAFASFEVTIMPDLFLALYLLALLSTQSSLVYSVSFHRVLCVFWMVFWVEILGFRSTLSGQFSHDTRLTSRFAGVLRVYRLSSCSPPLPTRRSVVCTRQGSS